MSEVSVGVDARDKFVYFDLGKVMVEFDHQIAVQNLENLSGCQASEIESAVFTSGLQDQFETGLVDGDVYAATINRALGTALSAEEIAEAVSAIFTLNDPILAALEKLQQAKVPMGVLSNTCEAHWQWIVRQAWAIPGDWFRETVLSYEVQSMKPDSKIYEVCEAKAKCDPGAIFFTDDRLENVQAAQSRGWTTHLFRSAEELCSSLDEWLAIS